MAEIVKTLLAERGRKYDETGEVIGSYDRSIVFLPKGVESGQQVRVQLEEIRADRAGRMMYRGLPAPVEHTEKWREHGDGTASRVKIAIDWQLQESEVEVVETRKLASREGTGWLRTNRSVIWDHSLVESFVEEVKVTTIPLETEVVRNGGLAWEKTADREEQQSPVRQPLVRVEPLTTGTWASHRLEVTYNDEWGVNLNVFYDVDSQEQKLWHTSDTWGDLPQWLQVEIEARYPVCVCGRQRRQVQVKDGYGQCEQCRAEETCGRCRQQAKVTVVGSYKVCENCRPFVEQEQLIRKLLAADHLVAIAREAQALGAVEPVEADLAEIVFKSGLEHLESGWDRECQQEREKGYRWYYFTPEGVFATKLDQSALALLAHLPSATGNSLVEMVSWFAEGVKPSDRDARWDFYLCTQVNGETDVEPKVTERLLGKVIEKLVAGEPVLADHLRGLEENRQKLLEWLETNTDRYQSYRDSFGRKDALVEAAQEAVKSVRGFGAVLQQIAEFNEWVVARKAQQEAGEIWMDVVIPISDRSRRYDQGWAIAPDGSLVEPEEQRSEGRRSRLYALVYGDLPTSHLVASHGSDNYGYRRSEDWEVHYLPEVITSAQRATLDEIEVHAYFRGAGTGWDLSKVGRVSFTTVYFRDLEGEDRGAFDAMCTEMPIDVSEYETHGSDPYADWGSDWDGQEENQGKRTVIVGPYRKRDPRARRLAELSQRLEDLGYELQGLEMSQEIEAEEYQQAELVALERAEVDFGTREVAGDDVFEVTFTKETHRGEERLVVGPFFDEPSGSWIKLVENPYSGSPPIEGQTCLVKVAARNSEQIHLFTYRTENPEGSHGRGGRKVQVWGYFAVPILSPKDHDREIETVRAEMAEVEEQVARLEAEIESNPVQVQTDNRKVVASVGPEPEMTEMERALRRAMGEDV